MAAIVAPSSEVIWESVATIVTGAGIEERQPRDDQEWADARRHAIALMETANLLLLPRSTARASEARLVDEELPVPEIERRIQADPSAWTLAVHGLHDAMQPIVAAIDARDRQALIRGGEELDQACERCHRRYWYAKEQPPSQ